jgi:hypothetical protein
MSKPAHPSQRRPRRAFIALPLIVGALLLAFAAGRWTADPAPPAAQQEPVARQEAPVETSAFPPRSPPVATPRTALAKAPPVAAPPPLAGPAPEVVARVTEEVKVKIETLRPQILSRCSPAGGMAGGARLTFNLTFDASGREIARGITGQRTAPGAELARCLREMDGIELAIPAPGASVAVAVPVTFP